MGRPLLPVASLLLSGCVAIPAGDLDPADIARAAAYSAADEGHALLILRGGEVLHEDYTNGWGADRPHRIASGTKSFWGLLAVAAVEDGLLELDEPAALTLTEWADDERMSRITIRQMLAFTSGLEPTLVESTEEVLANDLYAKALTMEAVEEPGAGWTYGSTNHAAFGALLTRKLAPSNRTVESYLHERILDPLGVEVGDWTRDAAGHLLMSSGCELTAREWSKVGELVRLGGVTPDGRRLLDAALLAEVFTPRPPFPMYGLSWWLETAGGTEAGLPDDFAMAAGAGKQYLYVLPSMGLTIVRMGESETYTNAEFFGLLFGSTRR